MMMQIVRQEVQEALRRGHPVAGESFGRWH
jgi:hypothetical protein